MNVYKSARLTPLDRAGVVRYVAEEEQSPKAMATAFGIRERTVRKWVRHLQAEGSQTSRTARHDRTP